MSQAAALLDAGLDQLGVVAGATVRQQLLDFVSMLARWNRVYNLTAVRTIDEMTVRHLLDSAALVPWLHTCLPPISSGTVPGAGTDGEPEQQAAPVPAATGPQLLDIGTGAGVPVLPLALLLPQWQFLSVESNGKKCRFQRQAMIELGINNVSLYHSRIENVHCEADIVLARAFTAPERFLYLAAQRCRPGGHACVLLGQRERLPEPLPPAWSLQQLEMLTVPGLDAPRHLAICRYLSHDG